MIKNGVAILAAIKFTDLRLGKIANLSHQTAPQVSGRLGVELQQTHEQDGIHDRDPVLTWQFLIQKWDEAYAKYRAAMETCARNETLPASADERETAEANVLAELTKIKQQIDQLIVESNSRRSPIVDSIVVGTFKAEDASSGKPTGKTGEIGSGRPAGEPGAFRPGALASKFKLPWHIVINWILRRCSIALQKIQDTKSGERYRKRNNQK